jgi:hypothetical protein
VPARPACAPTPDLTALVKPVEVCDQVEQDAELARGELIAPRLEETHEPELCSLEAGERHFTCK